MESAAARNKPDETSSPAETPAKRPAALRPKDAATLIILDRASRHPKVLMGRRHASHRFLPGKFVFPGGRLEAEDRRMPAAGALHTRVEEALAARVTRPTPSRGRALAMAAIRETFEETGRLIGTKMEDGVIGKVPPAWTAFAEHSVLPDLEAMHFIGRAITPVNRPKRFDTRFFAIDRTFVVGEVGGIIGPDSELTEVLWVDLQEARKLELPSITIVMLAELEARIAQGFGHQLPVPFFHPRGERHIRELV